MTRKQVNDALIALIACGVVRVSTLALARYARSHAEIQTPDQLAGAFLRYLQTSTAAAMVVEA